MGLRLSLVSAGLTTALATTALAASYTYDGQGRLQTFNTDDAKQTRYTLDDAGNRTVVASSATAAEAPTATDKSFSIAGVPAQPFSFNALQGGSGSGRVIVGTGKAQFGTVDFDSNTISYTPFAVHPAVTDSFGFTVQMPNGLTASAIANITMTASSVPQ